MVGATAGGDVLRAARRARVGEGEVALWNTGGAGFVLRTAAATLLIDPFLGPSNPPDWVRAIPPAFGAEALGEGAVDAVLITHEHGDHADPVALREVARRTGALVLGPESAISVAREGGQVPAERARVLGHGESVDIRDVRVTAVAMHDPSAKGANGYVVETGGSGGSGSADGAGGSGGAGGAGAAGGAGGVVVVHCGDSLYFPGFAELGRQWRVDALCVAVGSNPPGRQFYMDEADAARAARDAGAGVLVPMHFNLWQKTLLAPRRVATVARWYAPGARVVPAHLGRRISVRPEKIRPEGT